MGCDIHSYVETKNKNGEWVFVKDFKPFDYRDYAVFSFLANVRNVGDITPISEPKGLPRGLSEEVQEENLLWEGDAHSHSYLTSKELIGYDYDRTDVRKYLDYSFFQDVGKLFALGNPEDVRVVFWFDN